MLLLVAFLAGNTAARSQSGDPMVLTAKAAVGNITVDGKPDEMDWKLAVPYLKFGPNPTLAAGEDSVTGGTLVRGVYSDTSYATVKFLRKGMSLFVAVESNDKSVGKFGDSWEGDGLFFEIKDNTGHLGEFHLYFNDDSRYGTPKADSAVYETGGGFRATQGFGVGLANSGTVPYDTTQVDSGYKLELEVKLDSLGFSPTVDTLTVSVVIFDPDGYAAGTGAWVGPDTRTYYKSWWGSEWGSVTRQIYLEPQRPFDDPPVLTAKSAVGNLVVDGKLDEPDWANAKPVLTFGANPPVGPDGVSVTGDVVVRGPYADQSIATMKMLRKGMNLYLGIQSNDKSVGRFGQSWEGDGLFMKITNAAGQQKELHLYYDDDTRYGTPKADTAVFETAGGQVPTFAMGVGLANPGTVPYDTTQVDSGYTLEMQIKLDSLGFTTSVDTLIVSIDIFDPNGYPAGAGEWVGPDSRTFFKSFWGSEWGNVTRKIYLQPERPFDDPPVLTAKSAVGNLVVDGKLDEPDWANAKPILTFGANPPVGPDGVSVTGDVIVRGPYTDQSIATMKMLRKGMNLYLGVQSNDNSVGRFGQSWEGDGLFMKITNAAGQQKELHLYFNDDTRHGTPKADTAVFETAGGQVPTFALGVGLANPGTVPYDTTQIDSGYTLEMQIKLDSLGFTTSVDTLRVSIDIFDPNGYPAGAGEWVGPDSRTFFKSFWGSEWGDVTRKIYLQPERAYDDPPSVTAKAALHNITVDGNLNESDWQLATPILKFGYNPPVSTGEKSVTGGALVRGTYSDESYATVKMLRKGMDLYLGVQSNDKSVGKFGDSWEGDGLFMEVKNAAGQLGEFHLYFNDDSRVGTAKADSAVYEVGGGVSRKSQAFGIGLANAGTVPYDTTQIDNGYTLELVIHLDSLGFTSSVESLQVLIDIFDPDGYPAGAGAWVGPNSRAYYKSWWGSEWGPTTRTVVLEKEVAYQDPPVMEARLATNPIVVDGKLNEPDWVTAKPYLKFGPNPSLEANETSVTGGALVRGNYWDPSHATVKLLRQGMNLYVGVQSDDKSVGKFGDSWEGDGLFMEVKNAAGQLGEFHLYFNDDSRVGTAKADSAVYEVGGGVSRKSQAFGIGLANAGTVPYDTTQTDSGYTLELQIHLDSLGFTSSVESLQVLIDIFDPDGYPAGAGAWVGPDSRSYYKTWWGSEWGPVTRTIHLAPLTGVQEEKGLPTTYSLQQNYPNPFNPATTIKYGIPLQSFVTLKLYNMLGQEVAVLVNGEQHAGYYSVNFNANALASGLYFYRLQTGAFSATKKMMLVK
jgi:hypothetical protein